MTTQLAKIKWSLIPPNLRYCAWPGHQANTSVQVSWCNSSRQFKLFYSVYLFKFASGFSFLRITNWATKMDAVKKHWLESKILN